LEVGDEIWADSDALLAAARSAATDPKTLSRFIAHMGNVQSHVRLAGRSSDRKELLRIYRRRARRGQGAPPGTEELVHQLEQEPGSQVVLFAIEHESGLMYVFARSDLKSLIGCIVG
jgi:hypothetical protein